MDLSENLLNLIGRGIPVPAARPVTEHVVQVGFFHRGELANRIFNCHESNLPEDRRSANVFLCFFSSKVAG